VSFPQPKASVYEANGFDFFRLNTLLSSPGDIYESDESGLGLAIGPDSDVAHVNVAYFDAQATDLMQQIVVGPTRPFVGRLDANNVEQYSPSRRPGRILIWSGNLYDPNFRPRTFVNGDAIQFIQPRLDIIQYFTSAPSLSSARIDKEFQFQNYPVPGGKTFYLVVPCYERRLISIRFTNRNNVSANTFGVSGVTYAITDDSSSNPFHQETVIRAPAAVAVNAQVTVIVNAPTLGLFDALVFSFDQAGPAPLRIIMSDQE